MRERFAGFLCEKSFDTGMVLKDVVTLSLALYRDIRNRSSSWKLCRGKVEGGPLTYPDQKALYPSTEIREISVGQSRLVPYML